MVFLKTTLLTKLHMKITSGKSKALTKQLLFKSKLEGCSDKYGSIKYREKDIPQPTILHNDDAKLGANFYCYKYKEWDNLQKWADKDRGKKVNFEGNGLKNILRSEHIAYNLFYPIHQLNINNPKKLIALVQVLIKRSSINEINEVKIEYTPLKALNDNTSFDAYISYTYNNGQKGAIGIEIKYTETSYAYGKTEKKNMFDPTGKSIYLSLTKNCGFYIPLASKQLRDKKLKQLWRNHLLGISLCKDSNLDEFYSVHLYPKGNTYQNHVAQKYNAELKDDHKKYFIPITFEEMYKHLKNIDETWVDYFNRRYCE